MCLMKYIYIRSIRSEFRNHDLCLLMNITLLMIKEEARCIVSYIVVIVKLCIYASLSIAHFKILKKII